MGKGVLGNDPFQRGAALRSALSDVAPSPSPQLTEPKKAAGGKKKKPAAITQRGPVGRQGGWKARPRALPAIETPAATVLERPRAPAERGQISALSLAVQSAKGAYHALLAAVGASSSTHLDPYGEDPELVRQLSPVADFLYQRYWRVSAQGAENIPAGPVVLIANHSGALPLDGPVLRLAVRRERPELPEPKWLIDDSLFHLRFLGVLLNRIGAVRASPQNALRILAENRALIVFPEGVPAITKGFTERYHLQGFGRGGFVKVALDSGASIVPVAIVGAEEALPVLPGPFGRAFGLTRLPLATLPLPTKWTIRFGEPIRLDSPSGDGTTDLSTWVDHTRSAVQGMLKDILNTRRSIFTG
jgi:1-acyl-sn-glycerol-3-phosphate acyltransferase